MVVLRDGGTPACWCHPPPPERLAALGQPARVVLSAVTEQGQEGVRQSWTLPADALLAQIESAVGEGAVGAVKIDR